jgi:hypothetical protein
MYMTDQIPSDLLKLKIRLDAWRKKRKYLRQPIPDKLRRAVLELCSRYPPSLIRRVLKLQPSRLKSPDKSRQTRSGATPARSRARKQPQAAFFELPISAAEPKLAPPAPTERPAGSRLVIERVDGSRLIIFLPSLEQSSISTLCADFLRP